MRILITNDDGYRAKGIRTLAGIMAGLGEVTVVAPKYHQSGMGMAVSLGHKKIVHRELPEEGPGSWSYLDATPASCIKFALEYKFEHRNPDVVVTGINHGSNAGAAACYSATLGAAEEGALNGVRAIGVSTESMSPDADFSAVERYFPMIFKMLMENWPRDGYGLLYNVNFPDRPADGVRGIRFARQGRGHWEREYQAWDAERLRAKGLDGKFFYGGLDEAPEEPGEEAYMMIGTFIDDEAGCGDADHRLNGEGYITITPENIDKTDYAEFRRLRGLTLELDF